MNASGVRPSVVPARLQILRAIVADVPNLPQCTGSLLFTRVTCDGGTVGSGARCVMRKILVAVDGSELSDRALDHATGLARAMPDTRLHVVSVLPPVRVYGEVEVYAGETQMHELAARQAMQSLASAREKLAAAGVEAEFEELEGDPAETIARRAAELGCDSIVMGTHGRGRVTHLVLGSVAQRVVHLASVPVTLVR
jgi:nucleotide-binding universal stress UspA family protein